MESPVFQPHTCVLIIETETDASRGWSGALEIETGLPAGFRGFRAEIDDFKVG